METTVFSKTTPIRRALWALGAAFCVATALSPWLAHSDESVRVTAFVGLSNMPAIVSSVTPNSDPIVVPALERQAVSLSISDPDSPSLSYTITASSGAVSPENGTVSVVGGSATVGFTYYAPSNKAKFVPVTVTLNDGSGNPPSVRIIQMYVSAPLPN